VPQLVALGARHEVRCLLYIPGAAASPARGAAAARGGCRRAAPTAGTPLLQVQELHVRFPLRSGLLQRTRGWFDAVSGVSFDLRAGETLALVGESGCGKTTTGKAIVQLMRGVARTEGRALLDGRTCSTSMAKRCAPRAGACRSSSRTRLRR